MSHTMTLLDSVPLWRKTLAYRGDDLDAPREVLRRSFLEFRGRVKHLVSTLGAELPALTVHDVTHLDALWRVANEIVGDDYPLNPAEAYVLGGAFLLHDAAHVVAAYPDGLTGVKQTVQWRDLIGQRFAGVDPASGTALEKSALFQVLRHLHADQAERLGHMKWIVPGTSDSLYLIEHYDLRQYYGDLIGHIAASHHWPAERVEATFRQRHVACPAFLSPAAWHVDALKVALVLRTADAAHLDAQRAPWFLFALRQPQGISSDHWRFQAKLGQPLRTPGGELQFTSGAPFEAAERSAWWLAFDTARMVDHELRGAHEILREEGRTPFAASSVVGVASAAAFSTHLPVRGWEPIEVAPKVGEVTRLIASLGGAALYGDDPTVGLRELLQNGIDAVSALRALGNAEPDEGEVHVEVQPAGNAEWWLHVTDTGIGMSRFVLTNVLMDFGASLWSIDALREELPGLAKGPFRPTGKFGIGFFSVFMLGAHVRVTTRRYQPSRSETGVHWCLNFDEGLASRPALLQPSGYDILRRAGTRVSVRLTHNTLVALLGRAKRRGRFGDVFEEARKGDLVDDPKAISQLLAQLVAGLCPMSHVTLRTQYCDQPAARVVDANDWTTVSDDQLLGRVGCARSKLFALRESDGQILGRVGLGANPLFGAPGAIAYGGVLCGAMKGLAGVAVARANNEDARRVEARPGGSSEAWRTWADEVLQSTAASDLEARLHLHPLLPDRDLAVWKLGEVELTLGQLIEAMSDSDEIVVHNGSISHEDSDDMSSDRFDRFKPRKDIVCMPSLSPRNYQWGGMPSLNGYDAFPWLLGVSPINYQRRFKQELTARWGEFEEIEFDEYIVGDVEGLEVIRFATGYRRM